MKEFHKFQFVAVAFLVIGGVVQSTQAAIAPFYTTYPDCINGPKLLTTNQVCNTSASPAVRAAALVAAMPFADKLQNLVDQSNGSKALGLPPYEWWSEALHGVASSPGVNFSDSGAYSSATSFPGPISMSAAFDDEMIFQVASVIATEARAFSNHHRAGLDFFTPNINPYRDPRWGRGSETPGEDPFRIQGYVKNLLMGLEQKSPKGFKKIVATCKHFAGYDLEDWDGNARYGFDARITEQDLTEYYLPPFQQCSRDSQVGSVMCSYNAINGIPSCANSYLMNDILRKHWGWTVDNQYITSDCNAVDDEFTNHLYVNSLAAAAGVSYTAGIDTVCILEGQPSDVTAAHANGWLSVNTIDEALRRQFEALIILGYFDPASDNPYRAYDWSNVNTPSAQSLAREAAAHGIVLFKNNGFLPHTFSKTKKVAMIGMWANGTTQMQGNYAGIAPFLHSPLDGASSLGIEYVYANGPINETTTTGNWTEGIMKAAKEADIILYFGGIDNSVEAEAMDRYQIGWPASQLAVIKDICGLGKPCVVVQMGDQLDATPLLKNRDVSAVLWAGYPGQAGGPAVFDVLTGKTPPAGRLPVTNYPANYVNEVPMTDMLLRPGPENPGRTYMWYPEATLPFGYGLHYTKFSATFNKGAPGYGKAGLSDSSSFDIEQLLSSCRETHLDLCSFRSASVTVKNTGKMTSDFVTMVYYKSTAGPAPYPIKKLASYTRLSSVEAGKSMSAELPISIGTLARRDDNGNLVLFPGDYELLLDVPTQDTLKFTLTGSMKMLDQWPQPPAKQTYNATIAANCPLYGPCPWQPITPAQAKAF